MVCVFELVNAKRREVFVGAAPSSPPEPPPPASAFSPKLSHWDPSEGVELRVIEDRLPRKDAPVFIAGYAGSISRAGWKPITEP